MHLFSPEHVKLVTSCYPPSSSLLTSRSDIGPNAQELSRLTYYASNKPAKLSKLGSELEKRVKYDSRKAQFGNQRSRAYLLISLAIFKSLATECRRDISLLSPSLLSSLNITLSALYTDLEVCSRAASVFTTWTTFTDGHVLSVDGTSSNNYISTLRRFSDLSAVETKSEDHEFRNRTRLIGLAALTGAVNSEALYNTSTLFKSQASLVIHPILITLLQVNVRVLSEQASAIKDHPVSPYLSDFRTRPAMERRALSIHMHKDGDKGPSLEDVTNACLCTVSSLLQHSNGAQLGFIMQASFGGLKDADWEKIDHCCWIAEQFCEWAQYQYRYAIPTRLVERLVESQDEAIPTAMHLALAAMIKAVFVSPTPLVNLSTSDVMSNLVKFVIRRVSLNPDDALLPTAVQCIASLGTHVYYSDQIQDLAGDLITRINAVEVHGVGARGKTSEKAPSDSYRCQAIRSLLAGLLGLMRAADQNESEKASHAGGPGELTRSPTGSAPPMADPAANGNGVTPQRPWRRTRVPPELWQETLTLICDGDFAVRADYADALMFYLGTEIRKRGDFTDPDGVKRVRPLAEGPMRQAANVNLILYGDATSRLLNAVHAYMFVLATSSSLGLAQGTSISPSPVPSTNGDNVQVPPVNVQPATPQGEETEEAATTDVPESQDSSSQSQRPSRRSTTSGPSRSRKLSVVQRLLEHAPTRVSASAAASASDYAYILAVLTTVHEELPVRGLLTGIPMLLALDGATRYENLTDLVLIQRLRMIKEIIARVWMVIGRVWACAELSELAEQALLSADSTSSVPPLSQSPPGTFTPPRSPEPISPADGSGDDMISFDSEKALLAIVSSSAAQEATGLDRDGLLRRFATKWTADGALRESVERTSTHDDHRNDAVSPLLKISPALMHIDNVSLASLARSSRGVGVTDLREALEGRSSMSNPALVKPPSISTLEHTSVNVGKFTSSGMAPARSRSKKGPVSTAPNDVRDVLNKLGIGKQKESSLLKASFPVHQKDGQRSSGFNPPYKA